jgi:acetoacetyl-CoA synthetase
LWRPDPGTISRSQLSRYTAWLEADRGLTFDGYNELWAWSVDEIEAFWQSVWEYFRVDATPYETVLADRKMPGAKWFAGSELSYAQHIFRERAEGTVAIVHGSELRPQAEMTWGELSRLTAGIRNGLKEAGVERGDRIAAYMPNIPEAAAAFLACASIGAIWSSCSPDFGEEAVVDRFGQIQPKVLLAVDGYRYGGSDFDRREAVARIAAGLPSVERTFQLPYLSTEGNWADLLRPGPLEFEMVPFDHPLWILYSSGTTGLPKAIVHGHGGILLEHLKTLYLHFDAQVDDRLFWFTTTGWMMWNLLLGGLLTKATVVLYDGSPAAPDLGALWRFAAAAGVSCFGTSAAFIHACMKAGVEPAHENDLTRLRSVGSTGSPLSPEAFRWVSEHVGPDVWLFSMSGGTDVCTAFVGGVPTLPVYEGELQARALGAKVEAFDEEGRSVVDEVGELVLTEPLPSMPICFWGDDSDVRYRESYFERYPDVWQHGDWIEITSRQTAIIRGRSDATINRDGVRVGTSEYYRAVLSVEAVSDALVVDVPQEGSDGCVLLFVVLAGDSVLDEDLAKEIRQRVRSYCSPRHAPDEIRQISRVPRTLSGKLLEIPVKRILMGAPVDEVASRASLADPLALDHFVELATELGKPG